MTRLKVGRPSWESKPLASARVIQPINWHNVIHKDPNARDREAPPALLRDRLRAGHCQAGLVINTHDSLVNQTNCGP